MVVLSPERLDATDQIRRAGRAAVLGDALPVQLEPALALEDSRRVSRGELHVGARGQPGPRNVLAGHEVVDHQMNVECLGHPLPIRRSEFQYS